MKKRVTIIVTRFVLMLFYHPYRLVVNSILTIILVEGIQTLKMKRIKSLKIPNYVGNVYCITLPIDVNVVWYVRKKEELVPFLSATCSSLFLACVCEKSFYQIYSVLLNVNWLIKATSYCCYKIVFLLLLLDCKRRWFNYRSANRSYDITSYWKTMFPKWRLSYDQWTL